MLAWVEAGARVEPAGLVLECGVVVAVLANGLDQACDIVELPEALVWAGLTTLTVVCGRAAGMPGHGYASISYVRVSSGCGIYSTSLRRKRRHGIPPRSRGSSDDAHPADSQDR